MRLRVIFDSCFPLVANQLNNITSKLLEEVMKRSFRKVPISKALGGFQYPFGAFLIFIIHKTERRLTK